MPKPHSRAEKCRNMSRDRATDKRTNFCTLETVSPKPHIQWPKSPGGSARRVCLQQKQGGPVRPTKCASHTLGVDGESRRGRGPLVRVRDMETHIGPLRETLRHTSPVFGGRHRSEATKANGPRSILPQCPPTNRLGEYRDYRMDEASRLGECDSLHTR